MVKTRQICSVYQTAFPVCLNFMSCFWFLCTFVELLLRVIGWWQGYRIIAADAPPVWTHQEWVSSFEKFLDALGVHHVSASSLRARDHWNFKYVIGGKCHDCPTSLYTRDWGPKGPRKKWMDEKNLCRVLQWHAVAYCSVVYWMFLSRPPLWGGSNSKLGDHDISKSHNPPYIITTFVEGPIWIGLRAWVCMSTTFEGLGLHKVQSKYSMGQPLDEYQGPLQFHGHGPQS